MQDEYLPALSCGEGGAWLKAVRWGAPNAKTPCADTWGLGRDPKGDSYPPSARGDGRCSSLGMAAPQSAPRPRSKKELLLHISNASVTAANWSAQLRCSQALCNLFAEEFRITLTGAIQCLP